MGSYWAKYADRRITGVMKEPWLCAFLPVLLGLVAGIRLGSLKHRFDLLDFLTVTICLVAAIFYSYFIARTIRQLGASTNPGR